MSISLHSLPKLCQSRFVPSPIFEVVKTTTGATSIRNCVVNEIMHNPVGPWAEANSLYIEQSHLKEKLSQANLEELVVFDVGLGAAANALAAIHCSQNLEAPRKMRLISFERDLDLLYFALQNSAYFEHFHGFENIIQELLDKNYVAFENIEWELRHGDFVSLVEAEPHRAHIIFYDPYSPNVNQDMWTLDLFRKLRNKCTHSTEGAMLLTYSKATPIRSALLCAGFYAGAGRGTGEKDETTQAATRFDMLPAPFAERWLERWKKSSVPYPLLTLVEDRKNIESLILNHEQFNVFLTE